MMPPSIAPDGTTSTGCIVVGLTLPSDDRPRIERFQGTRMDRQTQVDGPR